jgi:outer membrane cobalamin receptor
MEPWYTSDLSLRYEWKVNGLLITAQAEVNNLLDQDYEVIVNYPMPGRNYALTLSVEI